MFKERSKKEKKYEQFYEKIAKEEDKRQDKKVQEGWDYVYMLPTTGLSSRLVWKVDWKESCSGWTSYPQQNRNKFEVSSVT